MNTAPAHCSLGQHGPGWKLQLQTWPEGAPHPVVIGKAGTCAECADALLTHAERLPVPADVVPNPDPADGSFCTCDFCTKFRNMIGE